MVSADRFRLSIVLRRLCPPGFRWSAALWRFPAVNRFAAVSACSIPPPGFRLSTVLRRFLHRIFGCRSPLQRLCPSGFRWSAALWRFPAVNRFAVVSACSIPPPGFRLSTVLRRFLHRIFGCRSPLRRFPPPDFGCMASGACRIASAGQQRPLRFRCARGSRPAVPGFRAVVHPNSGREFRRLPQKILSH